LKDNNTKYEMYCRIQHSDDEIVIRNIKKCEKYKKHKEYSSQTIVQAAEGPTSRSTCHTTDAVLATVQPTSSVNNASNHRCKKTFFNVFYSCHFFYLF